MEINAGVSGRDFSDLKAELARLQSEIRARPSEPALRIYLFQLLAVLGDWPRALAQLQACAQLSPDAVPMARTYREAVRCEVLRAEVFAGKRAPQLLGEPPEWVAPLIRALDRIAAGDITAAAQLRASAFEAAPATSGSLDGESFDWIADADSRLGPICEAIVNGQYYWIPFAHLRSIRIDPPADLRDLVWAGAKLVFANGGESVALIPTRYPGSEASGDDALKLARRTEWKDLGEDTFVGLGQRMWTTDAGEKALLEVRSVALGSSAEVAVPPSR